MIGVDVVGTEGLLKGFENYKVEAEAAINKAVNDTSLDIESDAKKRLMGMLGADSAPSMPKTNIKTRQQTGHGGSGLLGSIYNRVVESMEKIVGTDKHYAPYIEFGTGDLVFTNSDFDKEAKKVASQYKKEGIRKVNIRGDSFLNWAAVNNRKKLVERIKENLNKIIK